MKITRSSGIALLLALSSAFLTAQAASTDKKPAEKKAAPAAAAPLDQNKAMEIMAKAATPGEPHRQLAEMAGTWDAKVKMWMAPGAPPMESTGTDKSEMVMGGRYLQDTFEGTFMDKPFHGMGLTGYDNVTKKYWGTWVDDMGTGVMSSTGHMDKDGKSMTMTSTMPDPMTGKMSTAKLKMTFTDKDHHTMEMWGAGPDGKQMKMMEITYTRKG